MTNDIGTDRQLFVDDYWIEQIRDAKRVLHEPVARNIAIDGDKPWDNDSTCCGKFIYDDGKYRAWYRCDHDRELRTTRSGSDTAYAESDDGINWTKPNLGIFEVNGSKDNNIVWMGPGANVTPFKDLNPDAPDDERYKAVARTRDLHALVSADGINWRMKEEPISTDGPFDSVNIALWDTWQNEYVVYTRGVANADPDVDPATVKQQIGNEFKGGVRWIRRATSKDFVSWTSLEDIDCGDTPFEHFYTNACVQYERAPNTYLMFPSRFVPHRSPDPDWPSPGLSDIVFMSSRDGINFDRSFLEAFVRPGLDKENWHERGIYMETGIMQTSPEEMSLYGMDHKGIPSMRILRYGLRTDGFVSVNAGYGGGEFTTKPFVFSGGGLELNYSTSAVGTVKVEIQDAGGTPQAGFSLDDCPEMFADEIEGAVAWEGGGDVSGLAGKEVRLRFELNDADIYAFKFNG